MKYNDVVVTSIDLPRFIRYKKFTFYIQIKEPSSVWSLISRLIKNKMFEPT